MRASKEARHFSRQKCNRSAFDCFLLLLVARSFVWRGFSTEVQIIRLRVRKEDLPGQPTRPPDCPHVEPSPPVYAENRRQYRGLDRGEHRGGATGGLRPARYRLPPTTLNDPPRAPAYRRGAVRGPSRRPALDEEETDGLYRR